MNQALPKWHDGRNRLAPVRSRPLAQGRACAIRFEYHYRASCRAKSRVGPARRRSDGIVRSRSRPAPKVEVGSSGLATIGGDRLAPRPAQFGDAGGVVGVLLALIVAVGAGAWTGRDRSSRIAEPLPATARPEAASWLASRSRAGAAARAWGTPCPCGGFDISLTSSVDAVIPGSCSSLASLTVPVNWFSMAADLISS